MSDLDTSPVSATVYTDGKDATVFYSWQTAQAPPQGWELAGTLDVVRQEKGWRARAHTTDEKWQAVMEQAMPHFEAEVKHLISLLSEAGFGLQELKAFLAVGNNPALLAELDKKPS